MNLKQYIGLCTLLFALTGCGSGREDFASQDPSAKAVSGDAFNIRAGWQLLVQTGFSKSLMVGGRCSGRLQMSQGPAQPCADGIYSLTNTQLTGIVYGNCANGAPPPATTNAVQTNFYNSNYENTYLETMNGSGAWAPKSSNGYALFPTAVKVGDEGTIGTVVLYDRTGAVSGEEVWTYTIEANTATTIIFHLTKTTTDASTPAAWVQTQHERYKVNERGALELQTVEWTQADGFYVEAK